LKGIDRSHRVEVRAAVTANGFPEDLSPAIVGTLYGSASIKNNIKWGVFS
jgi:hypothetical protein